MSKIQIVGVCGGSGSGKTTIVNSLKKIAGNFPIIPQDNYYRSAEYVNNQRITGFNFDHPSAFDVDLLVEHLVALKAGRSIQMPLYDFVHHRRTEETAELNPARLVVLEGIMILFEKRIRDLLDLTLYVDTPEDIRFIRRLQRDISERGRTMESVIQQYLEVVRPGHMEFIEPTKVYADLIIPEGGANQKAMEVLGTFFAEMLREN